MSCPVTKAHAWVEDERHDWTKWILATEASLPRSGVMTEQQQRERPTLVQTLRTWSGMLPHRLPELLHGEAMHLAAGMQFAGFPSVIATLWSIKDEDAPRVAEHTYRYLLRNGLDKVDISEAAAALNHAVSKLREDRSVGIDRWAAFVHFGI